MINEINGDVCLPGANMRIGRNLSLNEFEHINIDKELIHRGQNTVMYSIKNIVCKDRTFGFVLNFNKGRLKEIYISIGGDAVVLTSKCRSAEKEKERYKEHNVWLIEVLGPKHEFRYQWGKVDSIYDDNYINSYIKITYEDQAP
jgi:hypothetical protein